MISSWQHMKCARLDPGSTIDPSTEVYGFAELTAEDQRSLAAELADTAPPKHIQAIDPDDPSFSKSKPLVAAPQPKQLSLPLLPYQLEGHGWMLAQELDDSARGGVLADEMGMGKTIQVRGTSGLTGIGI